MSFNLEHIDELKKRANVSYGDAKDALEKCNGNLLDALVYLENHGKVKSEQKCSSFKNLIHKANNTRFVIKKKDQTVLNLSVTISLIITVFSAHIIIPVLLLALLTGHRMRFEGNSGENLKVNETLNKFTDALDTVKKKLTEDDLKTKD